MFHSREMRRSASSKRTFAQRLVAFFLSVLLVIMVVDPIWEIHDHLDDIRHLGAHGILLILLIVLCAGISLLKSVSRAPSFFAVAMLPKIEADRRRAGSFDAFARFACAATLGAAALPLRI